MLILYLYVLLATLPAMLAARKGYTGAVAFFLSLALTPLGGLLFVLACNDRRTDDQLPASKVRCPVCKQVHRARAASCPHCGHVRLPVGTPTPAATP